ncbi:hypothetical protein PHJA_002598300 [Phtheirospermum japonicum]|uniref:Uncharacterized protein n=1 Tax=Phtheirospermum japonicum TaxID=374723 RepID=A0A830D8I7_9LAMI|nr:hypothetical protein PHJA_002598300 [Phtheirospermum japonicum]
MVNHVFITPTHFVLIACHHCDVFVQTSPYWVVLDYDDNLFAASFDIKTDELKIIPILLPTSPHGGKWSGLPIYLNPNAPRKRLLLETDEDTNSAEEMEDDSDEVDIISRLWESQSHLRY